MKRITKCFLGLLFFCLFLSINVPIYAADSNDSESLEIKSLDVPQEAISYAKSIAPTMLSSVVGNQELYGVSINNYDNVSLGEPYTIMSFDEEDSDIYYFPVLEDDEIKLILSVYEISGEWNATISEDIAEQLNDLEDGSDKEYILYYDNGTTYAQSENKTEEIFADESMSDSDNTINSDLSYEDKLNEYEEQNGSDLDEAKTTEQLDGTSNIGEDAVSESLTSDSAMLDESTIDTASTSFGIILTSSSNSTSSGLSNLSLNQSSSNYTASSNFILTSSIGAKASNPFLVKTSTSKILNTSGCLVNQRDSSGKSRGMCWAASVATIVRYMKGNSYLTAYNVCDKMGIDYDKGGTPAQCLFWRTSDCLTKAK